MDSRHGTLLAALYAIGMALLLPFAIVFDLAGKSK